MMRNLLLLFKRFKYLYICLVYSELKINFTVVVKNNELLTYIADLACTLTTIKLGPGSITHINERSSGTNC